MVDTDIARQRVLLLENLRPRGRATGAAACGRHWCQRSQIDSGVVSERTRPASLNGNPRVVTERRLPEGVPLVVVQAPFLGNVRRGGLPAWPAAIELGEHQLVGGHGDGKR